MLRPKFCVTATATLFSIAIACGGGGDGGGDDDDDIGPGAADAGPGAADAAPPPADAGPPPDRVWVVPWEVDICPGQRLQLKASAFYGEELVEVTTLVTWTTDDADVATVSDTGELLGIATGAATITAELQGVTDSAAVSVVPDEVAGLIIQPNDATVAAGLEQTFAAKTVTSCGVTQDVTASATWGSTVPSVAQVVEPGRVATALQGNATITASHGGYDATATLNVTPAVAESLAIVPALVALAPASCDPDPVQLAAFATFTDGAVTDVTGAATWTSDEPGIAAIVGPGLVSGMATGGTEVDATYSADGVTVTGAAGATVAGGSLIALELDAASGSTSVGATLDLSAMGTFPPSLILELTSSPNLQWDSSDDGVATVSNAPGSRGVVTGVGAGTAEITAHWSAGSCAFDSAPFTVSVTP